MISRGCIFDIAPDQIACGSRTLSCLSRSPLPSNDFLFGNLRRRGTFSGNSRAQVIKGICQCRCWLGPRLCDLHVEREQCNVWRFWAIWKPNSEALAPQGVHLSTVIHDPCSAAYRN